METIFVTRVNNDINGNPIYEVNLVIHPELAGIGRKKRNSNTIRRIQSYNIQEDISNFLGKKVTVSVTY